MIVSPAVGACAGGPRRVLITGGAGFLGQALVRELDAPRVRLAHEVELVAYDLVDAKGMPTLRGDVLDRAALDVALRGFDAVIHAATLVDWCELRARDLERVNVGGTRAVLEAAIAAGIQTFVHTSSLDVVGGVGDVIDATEERPYPSRFYDTYGRTKAEAEKIVRASSMPAAILRYAAMYGEADPYKVPAMVAEARAGRLLFRIGDGSSRMQPVYVGNAAVATLLALDLLLAGRTDLAAGTFFIADHPADNYFVWMGPIFAGLGYPLPKRHLPAWAALPMGTVGEWIGRLTGKRPGITRSSMQALCETLTVSDAKARRQLGYRPVYSYEEAVARTVAWFRAESG
jgi:nucleoside-diphosphate-sugar epimerase